MYITLLILPLLATGCGGRKETAQTMPVPEISVARPTVQNITLTKEYPGYLTSEKTVDLVGRVSGTLQTIAYAPGSRVRQGQVLFDGVLSSQHGQRNRCTVSGEIVKYSTYQHGCDRR